MAKHLALSRLGFFGFDRPAVAQALVRTFRQIMQNELLDGVSDAAPAEEVYRTTVLCALRPATRGSFLTGRLQRIS